MAFLLGAPARRDLGERSLLGAVLATVVAVALGTASAALAQQTDAAADRTAPEQTSVSAPDIPTEGRPDATQRLFDAVQTNDYAAVQASIAAGAEVSARDQWGLSPIELAIDKGYFEIAHFLLSVRNFDSGGIEPATTPSAGSGNAARGAAGGAQPSYSRANATASSSRVESSRSATNRSAPAPTKARVQVQPWPEGKPNPFDPRVPTPGAALPNMDQRPLGGETAAAGQPQVR